MKKEFSKVTISSIAEKAGVSVGTVDRVIHDRGEVAVKTREKILKIIKEMNYEPDIVARTLASKKIFRIAVLVPQPGTLNPFWKIPVEGMHNAWEEINHFGVLLEKYYFDYHDKISFSGQFEKILSDKPDGIILTPVFIQETIQFMLEVKELKIPVVFINSNLEKLDNITFVGQDSHQSGIVAARLLDYGLNEKANILIINFLSEKRGNAHILSREGGFREYFKSHINGHFKQIRTININPQDKNETEKSLEEHLGNKVYGKRTKGIFVTNSRVFLVADYLKKYNLGNIRLIGYDLLEQNIDHLRNDLVDFLISQKPMEQGYESVMSLFKKLIMRKEVEKDQFLPIDIITKENIDYYLKK